MLRNLIHRLYYRLCDLQYDAETGYSMVQRVCTKCGKIDFKINRVAKNYGRINKNLPRWHHNI